MNTSVLYVHCPNRFPQISVDTTQEAKYTECWPCQPFDILLNKYFLLASLLAGRRPQCSLAGNVLVPHSRSGVVPMSSLSGVGQLGFWEVGKGGTIG